MNAPAEFHTKWCGCRRCASDWEVAHPRNRWSTAFAWAAIAFAFFAFTAWAWVPR